MHHCLKFLEQGFNRASFHSARQDIFPSVLSHFVLSYFVLRHSVFVIWKMIEICGILICNSHTKFCGSYENLKLKFLCAENSCVNAISRRQCFSARNWTSIKKQNGAVNFKNNSNFLKVASACYKLEEALLECLWNKVMQLRGDLCQMWNAEQLRDLYKTLEKLVRPRFARSCNVSWRVASLRAQIKRDVAIDLKLPRVFWNRIFQCENLNKLSKNPEFDENWKKELFCVFRVCFLVVFWSFFVYFCVGFSSCFLNLS